MRKKNAGIARNFALKGLLLMAAIALCTGFFACKVATGGGEEVTGVVLDHRELKADIGQTVTLTATVFPENATDKTVIWSAEPENIVELTDGKDGRCTVKALKEGTVTVTATAVDGGFTATCTVTTLRIWPESIELDRDELKLVYGDPTDGTATLTATVLPENATDKRVRWTASPEGVVTLTDNEDGSCTVTAQGGESATVTAVSLVDPAVTAVCRISVDYLYLTNTALIEAIDNRAKDSAGKPISVDWIKESDGTVKLTPQNLAEIRAVTELNLDGSDLPSEERLKDLGGIEYFTGLTYLNCVYNNLETLDVTKNTALTSLSCRENSLETLDIRPLSRLSRLSCTPQWEGGPNMTWIVQLTLRLTQDQKLKLPSLREGDELRLDVDN